MDKEKMLLLKDSGLGGIANAAAHQQRDADLIVLERDYVPRERVKLLMEALPEAIDTMEANGYDVGHKAALREWKNVLRKVEEKP